MIERRGDARHRLPPIGDDELRTGHGELLFADDGNATARLRLRRIFMRVCLLAMQTEKEVSLPRDAAVRGQPAHLGVPLQHAVRQLLCKFR